jgi:hypothetical protein
MEPTHPDRLLENVTAPSAGGFPGPDGEVSRRDRRGRRGRRRIGRGKRDLHRSRFQQLPWSTESVSLKKPQKSRLQSMEPAHPDRLLENVTAPSAGGFPGPDGEVRLRIRLPFRTTSSLYGTWLSMYRSNPVAGHNNMVAVPGFPCPIPITRPFDTDTDPDPDLASPSTFSDSLKLHSTPNLFCTPVPTHSAYRLAD